MSSYYIKHEHKLSGNLLQLNLNSNMFLPFQLTTLNFDKNSAYLTLLKTNKRKRLKTKLLL